ncbi:permease [Candidatus Magnetomorum sp. HK-1]|nr:permease [Candidatus Magnetomorum sp. HK-1]
MIHPSDIKGIGQLATAGVSGITDLVASMHKAIDQTPGLFGATTNGPFGAISDIVYQSIHNVNNVVRDCMDTIIEQIEPFFDKHPPSKERDALIAVLNGVSGDYLLTHKNPLALPMTLNYNGEPLSLDDHTHETSLIPEFSGKLLVMAHGLCMSLQQWQRDGHSHAQALSNDFGYTPVYLHYNTGLHISTNGRAFADLLEQLIQKIPVNDFVILGYSMGGLLTRSAYYYAISCGYKWPELLRKQIFLGTPHHGAPLERGGNWINLLLESSPYAAPFAKIPKIRSSGITDLRYGTLLDEDWEENDRFDNIPDNRKPMPLPEKIQSYAIGGTIGDNKGHIKDRLFGDGIVPLESALGQHSKPEQCLAFPESHQWIGYGINHLNLLYNKSVYEKIKQWCAAP